MTKVKVKDRITKDVKWMNLALVGGIEPYIGKDGRYVSQFS